MQVEVGRGVYMITIGVLGVQGAVKEHIDKLGKISNVIPVFFLLLLLKKL